MKPKFKKPIKITQKSFSSLFLIVFLLTGWSCERLFIQPDIANEPMENFDYLWTTLDRKYSFFNEKDIDWDGIRQSYEGRIESQMTEEALFEVLAEMMNELEDGHVNLLAEFNVSRYWDWYLNYPENFNYSLLERNYLGKDAWLTGPFQAKILGDNVGYIYYGSFMGFVEGETFDNLLERFDNTKGLIIDIRGNEGGLLANVPTMVARWVEEETLTGYIRYKNGPAHDDFTRPIPQRVSPEGHSFTKPIVVLVNRKVYSAANDFAKVMKQLPQATLVGDRTGGGGGAPISNELPNGWRFRFSTNQLLDVNQQHVEFGIDPDVFVALDPADEAMGVDTILEYALQMFD